MAAYMNPLARSPYDQQVRFPWQGQPAPMSYGDQPQAPVSYGGGADGNAGMAGDSWQKPWNQQPMFPGGGAEIYGAGQGGWGNIGGYNGPSTGGVGDFTGAGWSPTPGSYNPTMPGQKFEPPQQFQPQQPPWASPQPPVGGSIGSGPGALTGAAATGIGAGLTPFNPQYLDQLTKSITAQQTRNLNENVLPGIAQGGQAAGQYGGGSRAELAKGVAMRGLGEGIANTVAPLYQQGYEASLGRNLQAGQLGMQGLLGLGGLDISRMNAETEAAKGMAAAAGAPQYSNPWTTGLGVAQTLYPILSGLWGK